jgi:ribonuclease Z
MRIKGFYYFGTGAGLPSLRRNVSAMAVDFEGEWFLFDCGEGTQQRIMRSPFKMARLSHIFISHFHGDHLYGLPGLLSTMQLQGVTSPLTIIGPKGIKEFIQFVYKTSQSKFKREITYIEIDNINEPETVYQHRAFDVLASKMKHRITCYAYRLSMKDLPGKFDNNKAEEFGIPNDERRGKLVNGETVTLDDGTVINPKDLVSETIQNADFTYVTDTAVCENIELIAKDSEYLHHECTFMDDETELAEKSGHCTLNQVIETASKINIKQLQLAHFSSRYDLYDDQTESFNHLPYKVIFTRDKLYVES